MATAAFKIHGMDCAEEVAALRAEPRRESPPTWEPEKDKVRAELRTGTMSTGQSCRLCRVFRKFA
jgi:hypothetical protein